MPVYIVCRAVQEPCGAELSTDHGSRTRNDDSVLTQQQAGGAWGAGCQSGIGGTQSPPASSGPGNSGRASTGQASGNGPCGKAQVRPQICHPCKGRTLITSAKENRMEK